MLNNQFLIYLLIGLGLGFVFQMIHDIVIKAEVVTEEELPDFTIQEHILIVVLWPYILLRIMAQLLFQKMKQS